MYKHLKYIFIGYTIITNQSSFRFRLSEVYDYGEIYERKPKIVPEQCITTTCAFFFFENFYPETRFRKTLKCRRIVLRLLTPGMVSGSEWCLIGALNIFQMIPNFVGFHFSDFPKTFLNNGEKLRKKRGIFTQ